MAGKAIAARADALRPDAAPCPALRRHAVAAGSTPALLPLADKPDRRMTAAAPASHANYFCPKNFSSEQNTCCLHPPASRCRERFRPHARVPQAQRLLPAPWHCPTARAVPCGRLPRPLHPRLTLRRPNGPPVQSTRHAPPSRHMFPGEVALPPAQPATNLPRRIPLYGMLGTPRRTRNRHPTHPPIRQNGTYLPKNILPKTGKRDIHCNSCQALEECSGRSSASCTICLAFFWRTKRKRSCPGAWPFVACLRFRSDIPRELRFGQRHTGTTLRAIRPPADRGLPARHRHTEAQPLPT